MEFAPEKQSVIHQVPGLLYRSLKRSSRYSPEDINCQPRWSVTPNALIPYPFWVNSGTPVKVNSQVCRLTAAYLLT